MSPAVEVKNTSDLEWASLSAYVQWLEAQSGTAPFSVSAVYSFQVTSTGFVGLLARKRALAKILEGNLEKLELWVAENEGGIDDNEMVFVRSLWKTTQEALRIVESHVDRASVLETHYRPSQEPELPIGGTENEPLF